MTPRRSNWLKHVMPQTAVYWGTPTPTGMGGYTFANPVEIDCRWEVKNELFRDRNGREVVSNAVVYVDQDVDVGGYLYLGDLDDLDSGEEADPQTVAAAYVIQAAGDVTNIGNTKHVRKVML